MRASRPRTAPVPARRVGSPPRRPARPFAGRIAAAQDGADGGVSTAVVDDVGPAPAVGTATPPTPTVLPTLPPSTPPATVATAPAPLLPTVDDIDLIDIPPPMDGASSAEPTPSPAFLTPAVRGMLAISLSAVLFGSNMAATKLVLGAGDDAGLSPAALCAARFAVAALCFAPALPRAASSPALRRRAGELGAYLAAGYITQAAGLAHTTASHGAFAAAFTTLVVPFFAAVTPNAPPVAPRTWAAAAVAVAGVALLTTDGGAAPNVGDAACIASAIMFGWHKFRAEAAADATPPEDVNALVAGQLAVLAAASLLAAAPDIAASVTAGGLTGALTDLAHLPWLLLAYMGVFTTALCVSLEAGALAHVSSSTAALLYAAEPVYGAGIASVVLGDAWTARGGAGAVLVVAASLAGARAAAGGKHKVD